MIVDAPAATIEFQMYGADVVAPAEQVAVVIQGRREAHLRRRRREVLTRLQRGHHHPDDRDERPQHDHGQHDRQADPASGVLHRASPLRLRMPRNTLAMMIVTTSIESPIAAAYPRSKNRKAVSYEADRDDLGRVRRPSVGGVGDDVEVADRVHRADQQRDDHHAGDHRQHDVAQPLEVARAVHRRRLQHRLGHRCQAGEHDQRDQRRPLPHVHQRDGQERRCRRSQDVPE